MGIAEHFTTSYSGLGICLNKNTCLVYCYEFFVLFCFGGFCFCFLKECDKEYMPSGIGLSRSDSECDGTLCLPSKGRQYLLAWRKGGGSRGEAFIWVFIKEMFLLRLMILVTPVFHFQIHCYYLLFCLLFF